MKILPVEKSKDPRWNLIDKVLEAVSLDTTRPYICHGFWDSKKKVLVATDGRRLHTASGPQIDKVFEGLEGDYFVEKKGKVFIVSEPDKNNPEMGFPNWSRVIPDKENLEDVYPVKVDFCKKARRSLREIFNLRIAGVILDLGQNYDLTYLEGLMGYEWKVYASPIVDGYREDKPVLFEEEIPQSFKLQIVIMPMRTDKRYAPRERKLFNV